MSAPSPAIADPRTRAALAAVVLAGTGAALLWWADTARADAQQALAQTRSELARSEAVLAAAQQHEAALPPALARWQALEAAGMFAAPDPARWRQSAVLALQRQDIDPALADLRFTTPQLVPSAGAAGPEVVASTLRLQLPLRHEGRLPPLVAALEALPEAVVAARGCLLERLPQPSTRHEHLHVECEFAWLTLTPPPAARSR